MHATLLISLTVCCFSQVFSTPVPTEISTSPPCKWTEWFNVDHPTEDIDSGDWETLDNITARGFDVCREPQNINCRSVRFPYVPFSELLYSAQCDRNTGLICLNKDSNLPCPDFEVQFLCCPFDQVPPEHSGTMVPSSPPISTGPPCKWTKWFNVDHPTEDMDSGDWETLDNITAHGFDVCREPQNINCRSVRFPYVPFSELLYSAQCDRNTGLICLNKDSNLPCPDFEVQFLCCPFDQVPPEHSGTMVPSSPPISTGPPCKWTKWFNVDHPTEDMDSGDWETLDNITAHGFDVCREPQNINCRSVRFPYVPFSELLYSAQCDRNTGLICLNKDSNLPCPDFEVQFLCCPFDQVPPEHSTTQMPALPTESTITCNNEGCRWTDWFNTHQPTPGHDGGDFENVTAIIDHGYSVCTAPQEADCRLVRFPYIQLKDLYFTQECTVADGLVCLNKDQEKVECLDFEVRFLCCDCEVDTSYYVTPDNTDQGYSWSFN